MDLRDLDAGAPVDRVLLVRSAARRRRRDDGSEYLRLELGDRSQALVEIGRAHV